ncbi:hypothetical protein [Hydrogenophaga sp.]|uniref:hypothetical protein n=1 Tax=Hydrogenophaga sp. TaxID=1904254 RepID=UPI003AF67979
MATELKPTPLRSIDAAQLRKDLTAIEARQRVLTQQGQQLLARSDLVPSTTGKARRALCLPCASGQVGTTALPAAQAGNIACRTSTYSPSFNESRSPIQITFGS